MKGRISAPAFVGLTSTNAAKMFGLYPKKGTIAINSDADIAIFGPKLTYTVRNADLNIPCDSVSCRAASRHGPRPGTANTGGVS